MKAQALELKTLVFLILMVVISILTFNVFSRYLNIIIVSLVIVQVFHPLFRFLRDKLKSTGIATFLSVLSVLMLLIIPLTLILILIVTEVRGLASSNLIFANITNLEGSINNLINGVNEFLRQYNIELTITQINLTEIISNLDQSAFIQGQLIPLVRDIASLSGEILFTIFLLILSLIYLFPSYDKLPETLSRISPLDNDVDRLFFSRFRDTIKGVVKGSLVVAILQATAVIVPLIILQVGAPVLLWIIMIILSIIPIGSGLVWGPISLAIILNGIQTGSPITIVIGIALFVYSAIIINVIDTTVRPRLMRNSVNLHPLITIFSVIGGIGIFGVLGILYGPLIVVLFLTIMEVYRTKYITHEKRDN